MNSPDTFRAGDSVTWSESLPEYPASAGWVLKFRLLWPSGADDIPTVAEGNDHSVLLGSADTADWPAGAATLVAWVEKGAEKITLGSRQVQILPDLSLLTTHDGRSINKRMLDALEATLLKHTEGGQGFVGEYEIMGRRMKFRDLEEMRDQINHYKRLVAKENAALAILEGGSVPGRVCYRAGSPR